MENNFEKENEQIIAQNDAADQQVEPVIDEIAEPIDEAVVEAPVKKNFPWWIIAVAAIVVAAIITVVVLLVPKYADYTVTVVDEIGNPVSNVMVKFTDSEGNSKTRITDKEGKVSFVEVRVGESIVKLEKGLSTVKIINDTYTLNKKTTELRAVVCDESRIQYIYGDVADDAYAYTVGEGVYNLPAFETGIVYLVFHAQKSGTYKVSLSSENSDATVAYHGIPMFVQSGHKSDGAYDGKSFELDIYDIGTPYVIGVNRVAECEVTLTVERIGDAPFDPQYAEAKIVKAEEDFKYYNPFVLNTMTLKLNNKTSTYNISIVDLVTEGIGFEGTYIATEKGGTDTKDVIITKDKIKISSVKEYKYKIVEGIPALIDAEGEKISDPDVKFSVKTDVIVTDLDISDKNLTVTAKDGYYYTSDGKQVYFRINSQSKYFTATLALIAGITDKNIANGIGGDVYDENGNFVAKYSYNSMITEYYNYIDANGLYPLTAELVEAIQVHGNHVGWWDSTNPNYIFSEFNIVPENAWLFLCCTAE